MNLFENQMINIKYKINICIVFYFSQINSVYFKTTPFMVMDQDPLDPQHFGFLDLDPDPRGKISLNNLKLQQKKLLSKPKYELLKKRDIKNVLISRIRIFFQCGSRFRIRINIPSSQVDNVHISSKNWKPIF